MNELIQKLHFKRIIIVYLIFAFIAGIASAVLIGYTFKDQLKFAYQFHHISERFKESKLVADKGFRSDLVVFADKFPDIVDVLMLDSNNNITFSAKNSPLAQKGTFTLTQEINKERSLVLIEDSNISFRLVKNDELAFYGILHEDNDEDDVFYEKNFNNKTKYFLSYIGNKHTGEKVYFIQNNGSVPNGMLSIKIVSAAIVFFFMLYWVILALWVYQNARKSKLNAVLWGIIALFTNFAGLLIYLLYKQNGSTCKECSAVQNKGNVYCINCGIKMADTCEKCGAIVTGADHFCHHCGEKIEM